MQTESAEIVIARGYQGRRPLQVHRRELATCRKNGVQRSSVPATQYASSRHTLTILGKMTALAFVSMTASARVSEARLRRGRDRAVSNSHCICEHLQPVPLAVSSPEHPDVARRRHRQGDVGMTSRRRLPLSHGSGPYPPSPLHTSASLLSCHRSLPLACIPPPPPPPPHTPTLAATDPPSSATHNCRLRPPLGHDERAAHHDETDEEEGGAAVHPLVAPARLLRHVPPPAHAMPGLRSHEVMERGYTKERGRSKRGSALPNECAASLPSRALPGDIEQTKQSHQDTSGQASRV